MKRGCRIAVVAHCVLNQNAVLSGWERASGAFNNIVRGLLEADLALVQLPCPEMTYGGVSRPPRSYADYDTPDFRAHCRTLVAASALHLEKLAEDGGSVELLLGIENSPCCDLRQGKGVFMEELERMLSPSVIVRAHAMVPEAYVEGASEPNLMAPPEGALWWNHALK